MGKEGEGGRGIPRRFVPRPGESAKSSVGRIRLRQWNYPMDRLKTRFQGWGRGTDLNARSRSTATRRANGRDQ